jgi:sugar/nucleoside kinase (ribokinase family)
MSSMLVAGGVGLEVIVSRGDDISEEQSVERCVTAIATAGGGWNVARALQTLGTEVRFATLLADDPPSRFVRDELQRCELASEAAVPAIDKTPVAVVQVSHEHSHHLFLDNSALDTASYPADIAGRLLSGVDLAVLAVTNFTRPLISLAQESGIPIAADVQSVGSVVDDRVAEYMSCAQILFLSSEAITGAPETWLAQQMQRYPAEIIVMGMGSDGCAIAQRSTQEITRIPPPRDLPVANAVGAGDALFAAFLHFLNKGDEPIRAIRLASHFAARKIGHSGGAQGFLTEQELLTEFRTRDT